MIHSFDIEDAKKYGVNAAIILNNIRFWVEKNAANKKHFHDGKYWTYNSYAAFNELFPYLGEKQIRNALAILKESNVIAVGNFNSNSYDRTQWYSLVNTKRQDACAETTDGFNQKGKTLYTDVNTDKTCEADKSAEFSEAFLQAWELYPKRSGNSKKDSYKQWKARLKSGCTEDEMIEGTKRYADYVYAKKIEAQYIKQSQTFYGIGEHFKAEWVGTQESKPEPAPIRSFMKGII